jgi:proteasome activator subunit 4
MDIPDISRLSINAAKTRLITNEADWESEEVCKFDIYGKFLPYGIEPRSKLLEILNLIVVRITQCVEARDYDAGLAQWDSMLN